LPIRKVLAVFLLCVTPAHLEAEGDPGNCSRDQGAQALEECLVDLNEYIFSELMLRGSRAALDELSFPETILVVPDAVEVRREVQGLEGAPKAEDLDVQNEYFFLHGDTAVLAGVLKLQGTMGGRPLPPTMRYLSVFVDTGEEWRLLARSLVPARKPGGRN
jgi:hypothetical protein